MKRRDFIKSSASVGVMGGVVGQIETVNSEKRPDLKIGRTPFVEIVIEYSNAPAFPQINYDGLASHVTDDGGGRVTLTDAPLSPFEDSKPVVTLSGKEYSRIPSDITHNKKRKVPTEVSYNGLNGKWLKVKSDVKIPSVKVSNKTDSVNIKSEGKTIEVNAGEGRKLKLEPIEVQTDRVLEPIEIEAPTRDVETTTTIPTQTETVTITPTIKIRHNGQMDIYGSRKHKILPLNSSSEYAKARTNAIMNNIPNAVTKESDNDLLLVPKREGDR